MHAQTLLLPARRQTVFGLSNYTHINYQLSPKQLIAHTLHTGEGELTNSGALVIKTGEFTGRSPLDKFIVKDDLTKDTVYWNDFNHPINEEYFLQLKSKMLNYLDNKDKVWVRDCYASAHDNYRLNIRIINENAWSNLFAYNMFLRPTEEELDEFEPEWHVIQAPGFKADRLVDGTRQHNFSIISFTHKIILIGGSGYTGEIKKGIFTILNYLLPFNEGVLSMHCSANVGKEGDTAIFFGLSGTGKTTLSADPNRKLIGDDEHGWTANNIFNFEGGCYAKVIDLNADKEPEIFKAIKQGALVENTTFLDGTNRIDFASKKITENTRVSYPLHYISNTVRPSIGCSPKNIFFLTCDASGVLPPISKLTPEQAMYQFISGYTAKVAGTEAGVTEPKSTFSACFGAPFLPLHPDYYAQMLGKKIMESNATVWLINTGWSGGSYGTGSRIKLDYTRAMITAALNGDLNKVAFEKMPVFNFMIPKICTGVPGEILNPKNTWFDKEAYDAKAKDLAKQFIQNFEKYKEGVAKEILLAAPVVEMITT